MTVTTAADRIRLQRLTRIAVLSLGLVCLGRAVALSADDRLHRVEFRDLQDQTQHAEGKLLIKAADGGLLLVGRDGRLFSITPDKLKKHEATEETFKPYTADEMAASLEAEFGDRFEIVKTKHYVICASAGKAYGRWCGALFERLMAGFQRHWRTSKLKLSEPEFPLTAVVFADAKEFAEFAARDIGPQSASTKGYFSVKSNRMVLYDLTAGPGSKPAVSTADVLRKVAASPLNVATVVHEATHQIAFNTALHVRYADNPLWLSEGLAIYFETPDLRSRSGWKTIGRINRPRLRRFQDYLQNRRPADSLKSLLTNDERFRDAKRAADAYAEAWALTYFLIKTKRKEYVAYLNRLSGKPRLVWDDSAKRMSDFQAVFGDDLERLDREFLAYIKRAARSR